MGSPFEPAFDGGFAPGAMIIEITVVATFSNPRGALGDLRTRSASSTIELAVPPGPRGTAATGHTKSAVVLWT